MKFSSNIFGLFTNYLQFQFIFGLICVLSKFIHMTKVLIKGGLIVNENQIFKSDIYIKDGRIELIGAGIQKYADEVIDASGKYIIPGIIDDQVHFREPGTEYKGNIFTESRAALYGGVTSFMDMPNNKPSITTQESLQMKYDLARTKSAINYSFYMGAANDNLDEILRTDDEKICGVKIFMGSSTGSLLVDDTKALENIFSQSPSLIATHCEDEKSVKANEKKYYEKYGDNIAAEYHPVIRNDEVCYLSSSFAVDLAKKSDTRLHVLHLTSAMEMPLFDNKISLLDKRITSEVCVHHLFFDDSFYPEKGNLIKCNPAIKTKKDNKALWEALLDNRLDVIATDHAPHTWDEKSRIYRNAPSGLPLVQHSLFVMLGFYKEGKISLEKIVDKMCHSPAQAFKIKERGYIREGYWGDIVIMDMDKKWKVSKENIMYKCNWSPFEGHEFAGGVEKVLVNGELALSNGELKKTNNAQRLLFKKDR